ncbi:MAG: hypothetical protein JO165_13650 [Candidatus Eremiobacteraeota bacterium]|nr:hypothetical protein [Candidatus Eremiobacteraeota bacterium]
MSAVAQPAATQPQGDSWGAFAQALADESAGIAHLQKSAHALTEALVDGDPEKILAADANLNAARDEYQNACGKRRGMQARGFGTMTLRQVCQYAPRQYAGQFNQRLAEITFGSIQLGITISNNKALIVAGMDRLVRVTAKLQECATERTGIYKRRGYVRKPDASVIMSSSV